MPTLFPPSWLPLPNAWAAKRLDARYKKLSRGNRTRNAAHQFPQMAVDRKVLFIHIPKCAGISVCEAVYGPGAQIGHARHRDYSPLAWRQTPGMEVFSVVRNPWDRLLSAYTFLMKGGMRQQSIADGIVCDYFHRHFPTFRSFVVDFVGRGRIREVIHLEPQADYLAHDTQWHRLEDISATGLNLRSGLAIPIPRRNASRSDHDGYRAAYDDQMRELASIAYADDIAKLGYSF